MLTFQRTDDYWGCQRVVCSLPAALGTKAAIQTVFKFQINSGG